jgi:hypothetical protein
MDKKIFYNGDEAYHVVRTIGIEACNPRRYGIPRDDEQSYTKVLQVWRDTHHCDHVLRNGNQFMLCRTIKDAEIIE